MSNEGLFPRFYMEPVLDEAATKEAGRPIYNETEMVEIRIAGDRLCVPVFPVDDEHRHRWPDAYAAFKRGQESAVSGTPLEHWPPLTKSRVMELKALNIFSVEQLADIPDAVLTKIGMGAREVRDQARAYIATAAGSASETRAAAENARLKEQIERLQEQMTRVLAAPRAETVTEDKALEDCTDDELKAFIARESGKGISGRPSRDTLIERARALATGQTEAA